MSLVIDCDIQSLSLDDIFRMVSATDADGNYYIRLYNDGTDPDTLSDLIDCQSGDVSILDILRGALVTNDDGEYALNVAAL
jgi:hypothetical protein